MRQLILKHKELMKENAHMRQQIEQQNARIEALKKEIEAKQKEFETLKMARLLQISDNDLSATKQRLAKMLRSVNQCITLMSAK